MKIEELNKHGVPDEILTVWRESGVTGTLPIQDRAIQAGLLKGKSLLLVAPTSSGKSFVGEMVAVTHAMQGRKTLYLVPFKAIAEERNEELVERYSHSGLGLITYISDKDHREHDTDLLVGRYDIGVLTYEKLSALLVSNPGILDNCDCIVVDEVQMIMDTERGGALELLLTKLRVAAGKKQILALSAVLGDLNGFDKWLGTHLIQDTTRPVELRQGVLSSGGTFEFVEWNSKKSGTENLGGETLNQLVMHLVASGEQVIVVRNSVRAAQATALEFATYLSHLPAAAHVIDDLKGETATETSDDLFKTLRHQIAFHHADCELVERRAVERGFRSGHIRVIASTTTLSMGVNLPCKTVILGDNNKWGTVRGKLQEVPWSVGEVRNIFGRAGRLQKTSDFGRGIFIASDTRDARQVKARYLAASLEPLKSAFEQKDIGLRVLDVVATRFAETDAEISKFIFSTFAARNWTTDDAKNQIQAHIQEGIRRCLELELMSRKSSGKLVITELGRVCASKQCSFDTFQSLKQFIQEMTSVDNLDIAFAAAAPDEVSEVYYRGVKWEDGNRNESVRNRLNTWSSESRLFGWIAKAFQKLRDKTDGFRAKEYTMAALSKDLLETPHPTKLICESYRLSGANIRNMASNLSWMVDTLAGIAGVIRPQDANNIQQIADCLQHRVPLDCRHLNRLPVSLSRDEKIQLVKAGVKSEDDFLEKVPSDFKGIINPQKAEQIIKKTCLRRQRTHDFWLREHKRRLDALGFRFSEVEDIYKHKGRDLESAIERLFATNFGGCSAMRITDQRQAEPDQILTFPRGEKMTAQTTAKDDNNSFVDSKKAGDVIPQSARFHPTGFICFGRPDFQRLAQEQAGHQAVEHNFKLIPIYILAELYVRFREQKLTPEQIRFFLLKARGYLNLAALEKFLHEAAKQAEAANQAK
jgi:replicative superfamily II helicase